LLSRTLRTQPTPNKNNISAARGKETNPRTGEIGRQNLLVKLQLSERKDVASFSLAAHFDRNERYAYFGDRTLPALIT
jgi:hypothetical protein